METAQSFDKLFESFGTFQACQKCTDCGVQSDEMYTTTCYHPLCKKCVDKIKTDCPCHQCGVNIGPDLVTFDLSYKFMCCLKQANQDSTLLPLFSSYLAGMLGVTQEQCGSELLQNLRKSKCPKNKSSKSVQKNKKTNRRHLTVTTQSNSGKPTNFLGCEGPAKTNLNVLKRKYKLRMNKSRKDDISKRKNILIMKKSKKNAGKSNGEQPSKENAPKIPTNNEFINNCEKPAQKRISIRSLRSNSHYEPLNQQNDDILTNITNLNCSEGDRNPSPSNLENDINQCNSGHSKMIAACRGNITPRKKIKRCASVGRSTPKTRSQTDLAQVDHWKRNRKGESELHEICGKILDNKSDYSINLVIDLLENGANPNTFDVVGWTPMHEAIEGENAELLDVLLKYGGQVNAYREESYTALHDVLPAETDIQRNIIKLLLSYGADINAKDIFGVTPLQKAGNNLELVDMLKSPVNLVSAQKLLAPERPQVIFGSRLSDEETSALNLFCKRFQLKLFPEGQMFSSEVTHVIVRSDPCEASHDIFLAILQGCYVLTIAWVEDSLDKNTMLPPEDFEVTGTIDYPNTNAFQRSRINSSSLKPRLFKGGSFHILATTLQKISPKEKNEMTEIITAGRGKILIRDCKSLERNENDTVFIHSNFNGNMSLCSIIVLYKVKPPIVYTMEHIKSFPYLWLYESVQTFSVKEPSPEILAKFI